MPDGDAPLPDYLLVRDRPTGITLLSILSIIGGLSMAGLLAYGAFFVDWDQHREQVRDIAEVLGVPFALFVGAIVFMAALALAGGVEMWRGTPWGWRLGSFWFAYAMVREASALAVVYQLAHTLPAEEPAATPGGVQRQYIKFGGRLVVSTLLYLYFFKGNVREYFGLRDRSAWKAVLWQFGICLAIVGGVMMWTR